MCWAKLGHLKLIQINCASLSKEDEENRLLFLFQLNQQVHKCAMYVILFSGCSIHKCWNTI